MSSERVYLHYEPASGGVACTESIPLTKDSTVKYLIQKFIERSATRGVALRQSEARVLDEHGEALDMTDIVLNAVGNKADLFLSISPKIAGHPDTKKTTVSGKCTYIALDMCNIFLFKCDLSRPQLHCLLRPWLPLSNLMTCRWSRS